jgi:TetR/AcrR family transcriptional regulator
MRELVGFSFDYLEEHPEFIALLTDENRQQGSHIRNSVRLRNMHSRFIDMLTTTLQRGIKLGLFRGDLDPVNLYISIAGISYFFFSNNHTLSGIFGKRLSSQSARVQRRQHVIKFALDALRP